MGQRPIVHFEAPRARRLDDEMARFLDWFNQRGTDVDLRKPAIAHLWYVTLALYDDGNGRTAQAVESFLLYRTGTNARGYYSLANYYYRNRNEYIHQLNRVRTRNDLTPFVTFTLQGMVSELQAVYDELLQ